MLKKLKSLFIVEEDESKKPQQTKPASNQIKESEKVVSTEKEKIVSYADTKNSFDTDDGFVDDKIIDKLLQAIEKHNQSGFDYIEFKKSLQALEKMDMDESTKYRSAFATASTIGATLPKLVESAKFYIGIIDRENSNFLGSFDKQYKAKIASKEKQLSEIEQQIKNKQDQISLLTEEIEEHKNTLESTIGKLDASKEMMQSTQENFKVSYYNLRSQFESDIQKMEKYLK